MRMMWMMDEAGLYNIFVVRLGKVVDRVKHCTRLHNEFGVGATAQCEAVGCSFMHDKVRK